QDVLDPALRIAGRFRRDPRVDHVRHHHRVGPGLDSGDERDQVERADLLQRAVVHRVVDVGVLEHRAVPGEVLEGRGHAGLVHAFDVGTGEGGDYLRVGRERAVADGAVAATEVDHRREAQVHAAGAHFAGHQPGVLARELQRVLAVAGVELAETFQRRQRGVALAEALYTAAFLVDANELRARRALADRLRQLG